MYRYSVDEALTYTPDDLELFRESPFAVWMERLTLENPEHGIPPDLDSIATYHQPSLQDNDIVATLRAEGRNVVLISPEDAEPSRRVATLEAMRAGADFIVSGQLARDALSCSVDLLMRTSGFSELGDFLYIPCDTRADKSLQSAFRLCFFADLLAGLQGQLPPQMLIIRNGAEVVPLQTQDHIHYYRAVLKRFLKAMSDFRKHRMPDPSESAHFGRWAECASEVLKQRADSDRHEEPQEEQSAEAVAQESVVEELPQLRVAGGAGGRSQYDMDTTSRGEFFSINPVVHASMLETAVGDHSDASPTLAEQARMLKPDSYRSGSPPGHTPSLARIGKPRIVAAIHTSPHTPPATVLTADVREAAQLPDSSPMADHDDVTAEIGVGDTLRPAPSPNLRDTSRRDQQGATAKFTADVVRLPELEPRPPVFLPPDEDLFLTGSPPGHQLNTTAADDRDSDQSAGSVVDLDSAPASSLAPVVQRAEAVFERLLRDDPMFKRAEAPKVEPSDEESNRSTRPFSNSLQTSEEFNDS